jgi:hypothetical protein
MIEARYEGFDTYVSQMEGLSPATKLVAMAWRRLQDKRTVEHERCDGMWLVQLWELEEETKLARTTVRDALGELARFQIIEKRIVRATRNKAGEMWLSRIFISNLEHAQLNGDIPQKPIRPIVRCSSCASTDVVDTMTRTCRKCGTAHILYQTDHGANYDQVVSFCNECLVRRANCNIAVGIMIRVYKTWFFLQEKPGTKKPLKAEGLKRVLAELSIQYHVSNSFRCYEGVGLTPHAQHLLEGNE